MRAAPAAPTVLALAAVALGAGSGDAIAATVARSGDALAFTAAPGERNRLTIARGAAGTVVFHDDGASVSGCGALDAQTVRCPAAGATIVDLGDGDDALTVSGPVPVTAAGGDGSDRVSGGAAADGLDGGAGDDVVSGGGGDDALTGGEGADTLDGGSGSDVASWADHAGPVTADLTTGNGGTGATEDRFAHVEGLVGGAGDDVLTGGPRADVLVGGGGRDRLDGGAGDDALDGGAGSDVLRGGDGRDALDAAGGRRDRDSVACGAGDDAASGLVAGSAVGGDCEVVEPAGTQWGLALRLAAAPRRASTPVLRIAELTCYARSPRGRCTTTLRVRAGARTLASRTLVLRDARNGAGAALRLDAAGLALVRRRGAVGVRVEVRGAGCANRTCAFSTTLRAA